MRLLLLAGGLLLLARMGYSAANVVPATRADDVQVTSYVGNDAQKARDMAPPECSSIRSSLVRIVYIGGSPGTPGNQSELVLGRPAFDLGAATTPSGAGRATTSAMPRPTRAGVQRILADAPARCAAPLLFPHPLPPPADDGVQQQAPEALPVAQGAAQMPLQARYGHDVGWRPPVVVWGRCHLGQGSGDGVGKARRPLPPHIGPHLQANDAREGM